MSCSTEEERDCRSVLGLSRSGEKRVPSPPLWLQTNISSSAPGVTYINAAPTVPHLDAERRIRHRNHSPQTAERVEAWLLYTTSTVQQLPRNASISSTVRSVMSKEAAFYVPGQILQAPHYCFCLSFCLGKDDRQETRSNQPLILLFPSPSGLHPCFNSRNWTDNHCQ